MFFGRRSIIAIIAVNSCAKRYTFAMRVTQFFTTALLVAAGVAEAASSWTFDDASVSVVSKKASDGSKAK